MNTNLSALTIAATKPRRKPAKLLAEMGIAVEPLALDEGNVDRYVLSETVAIDRRTASGFCMGIMDKTLFTSAIYLREHFLVPVLIVEGQVDYAHSRFDPQAIRGAMSSMMLLPSHVKVWNWTAPGLMSGISERPTRMSQVSPMTTGFPRTVHEPVPFGRPSRSERPALLMRM